jgi:hypothetical protein
MKTINKLKPDQIVYSFGNITVAYIYAKRKQYYEVTVGRNGKNSESHKLGPFKGLLPTTADVIIHLNQAIELFENIDYGRRA